ncbi:hypothetical protein Tco_0269834 [Tanacetum coccineum]
MSWQSFPRLQLVEYEKVGIRIKQNCSDPRYNVLLEKESRESEVEYGTAKAKWKGKKVLSENSKGSHHAMCANRCVAGIDWSDKAKEEIQENNMASHRHSQIMRSVGHKEYLMGLLRTELEKVKEEKEGFEF